MQGVLIALVVVICLATSGCTAPGDWWPFGGVGGAYNSNTADEASNYSQRR